MSWPKTSPREPRTPRDKLRRHLLTILHHRPGLTAGDMVTLVGVSRSALSRVLVGLKKDGLVCGTVVRDVGGTRITRITWRCVEQKQLPLFGGGR